MEDTLKKVNNAVITLAHDAKKSYIIRIILNDIEEKLGLGTLNHVDLVRDIETSRRIIADIDGSIDAFYLKMKELGIV